MGATTRRILRFAVSSNRTERYASDISTHAFYQHGAPNSRSHTSRSCIRNVVPSRVMVLVKTTARQADPVQVRRNRQGAWVAAR